MKENIHKIPVQNTSYQQNCPFTYPQFNEIDTPEYTSDPIVNARINGFIERGASIVEQTRKEGEEQKPTDMYYIRNGTEHLYIRGNTIIENTIVQPEK